MTPRQTVWNAWGFPLVMVAACIVTIVAVARRPDAGTTDFRTFYQSSRQYLANTDPYFPFDADRGPNLNPPWVVAIMAQLCRVSLPLAAGMWWAFSLACFFTAIVLIARAAAPGQAIALASIVLVTQAAYVNLRLGQVAWQVMLLLTAAWLADRSRRPVWCGVLLGLAASWKPFLLVFVPYLLWRREWRVLVAMTLTIVGTIVLGLLTVGATGYGSWVASLRSVGWAGHPLNASLRALLTRALTVSSLAEQHTTPLIVAPWLLNPVWVTIVAALAAIGVRHLMLNRSVDIAWAILTLAAVLMSPLGWVHYVPLVTGPLVAVLAVGRPAAIRVAAVGVALLCVPFAWLKATTFDPALTITVASSYSWGTLLLLIAALLPRARLAGRPM